MGKKIGLFIVLLATASTSCAMRAPARYFLESKGDSASHVLNCPVEDIEAVSLSTRESTYGDVLVRGCGKQAVFSRDERRDAIGHRADWLTPTVVVGANDPIPAGRPVCRQPLDQVSRGWVNASDACRPSDGVVE